MRFNPWLVAVLAAMPLLILVVGLAAAGEGLGSPVVVALVVAIVGAAGVAAWKAIGRGEAP